jgi:hypothetical protein
VSFDGSYSSIADEQLDALEQGPDPDLYNGALDACQLIFDATGVAQQRSTAITTTEGVRFRLPIVGHPPYKVFWSHTDDGPRVEAVFPHP